MLGDACGGHTSHPEGLRKSPAERSDNFERILEQRRWTLKLDCLCSDSPYGWLQLVSLRGIGGEEPPSDIAFPVRMEGLAETHKALSWIWLDEPRIHGSRFKVALGQL